MQVPISTILVNVDTFEGLVGAEGLEATTVTRLAG